MNASGLKNSVRGEINVTPLVDVCLVLLIIFMVVTPIIQREHGVQLPKTQRAEPVSPNDRQLTVTVRLDGSVLVEGRPVPDVTLHAVLRGLRAGNPDRPVIVKGDRRLRYERICQLLEVISDAGFRNVGLITELRTEAI